MFLPNFSDIDFDFDIKYILASGCQYLRTPPQLTSSRHNILDLTLHKVKCGGSNILLKSVRAAIEGNSGALYYNFECCIQEHLTCASKVAKINRGTEFRKETRSLDKQRIDCSGQEKLLTQFQLVEIDFVKRNIVHSYLVICTEPYM